MDLTELFCDVDDFCKNNPIDKQALSLNSNEKRRRNRKKSLTDSEIMAILICFHSSNYRNFKAFYLEYVCNHLTHLFPGLLSYTRFVAITPGVLVQLCAYFKSRLNDPTGISYIDKSE
jgi:hypothetical protein